MTAPGATSDHPVPTPRSASVSRAGASALWRDVAGGAAADPGFAWALVVGVVLIALGLLGFVPNPLVGAPSAAWGTPLLLTGDAHDVIHLVGGAIAIHAALGLSRARRDVVLIGLGAAALILLALGLLDGRWFGIAPYAVGLGDQLLHLVVGLGSLVMGLAGTGTVNVPIVTGAYRRAALGPSSASKPDATHDVDSGAEAESAAEADAESVAGPDAAAADAAEPIAEAGHAAAEAGLDPLAAAADAAATEAGPADLVEAPTEPLGLQIDDEPSSDVASADLGATSGLDTLATSDVAADAPAISVPPDSEPAESTPADATPAEAVSADSSPPPDETRPPS